MKTQNNIPYSKQLVELKNDLATANNMGINFIFNRKSYKTLNFDMNFPEENLKNFELKSFNAFLNNKQQKLDFNKMVQVFNQNLDIIEFLKNKSNIDFIIDGNLRSLTLKNKSELTYEPEYFSSDNNVVATILYKIFYSLKREFNSNIIYFNSYTLISKYDINGINTLDEYGIYELIFNKYLELFESILNIINVDCWTLVNILNLCLLSSDKVTTFFNKYMEILNKNYVLSDASVMLSFTNKHYEQLQDYSTYLRLMFNIFKDDYIEDIMDLIMGINFIFIEVNERNIIVKKYSTLSLDVSFLQNLPLALIINKETYNFGSNKFTNSSQFRWSVPQNSLNEINNYDILTEQMPYINKMIFMISDGESLSIFDKYNIKKPSWLFQEENQVPEEEETKETTGGKLKRKNKTNKNKTKKNKTNKNKNKK
jgi:hypothetical protein